MSDETTKAETARLRPCPRSPNCVSTESEDRAHRMEAIPFRLPTPAAREVLLAVLRARPRTEIVAAGERYLHATETSALLRFVDDVELVLDEAAMVFRFRSASRVGYSDLGVNRKRMREIGEAYRAAEGERVGESNEREEGVGREKEGATPGG